MKLRGFFIFFLAALAGAKCLASADGRYTQYQRILLLGNDSIKAAALVNYAIKVSDSLYDYKFATLIFEKAKEILSQKKYPTVELNLYFNWASTLYKNGSYNAADKLYVKALSFKLLDNNPALKAKIISNAGANLQDLMAYKRALVYYNEALELYTKVNDVRGIGKVYQNMANIFALTGNLRQSDQFFDKAIKIFLENNLIENYGIAIGNKAYVKWQSGNLNAAKLLAVRSLQLDIKKIKDFNTYIDRYFNLGILYCEAAQWDSCFYALNRGKKIADSLHLSQRMDGAYYYNTGYCYVQKGDKLKGIQYYKQALKNRKGISNYRFLYDNISELYFSLKCYDTALVYKDASLQLADSIYKSELQEHIVFENKRIELLEKDHRNEMEVARQQHFLNGLKKRNYLLMSLVILLVAVVLLLFLYFRQYRLKVTKEHLQSELDFLKAQMNPHFLFNSINNIYVLLNEDKDKASGVLLKFSELLRYQLYECNVPAIAINKELQFLENYIEFENLRYSNKITVNYELKNNAAGNISIAPLLLQPFIENAFKHTPKNKNNKSVINIRLVLAETLLHLEITNTLSPEGTSGLPGGVGLENVRKRLNLLYPNRHNLKISKNTSEYAVNLKLNLTP